MLELSEGDTPEKGLSRDVDDLTSTHNRYSPRVGSPERREMLRAFHDICNIYQPLDPAFPPQGRRGARSALVRSYRSPRWLTQLTRAL